MKRFFTFSVLFYTMFIMNNFAQSVRTNGGGAVITQFSPTASDFTIISDSPEQFVTYRNARNGEKKWDFHAIETYNKNSHTTHTQPLTLPASTMMISAQDVGDSFFVTYAHYPNRHQFYYQTARIPKNGNTALVTPENRLTFDTDARGNILQYIATSPDNSKHNLNSYLYYAGDIIYQKFDINGEKIAENYIPKEQMSANNSHQVTVFGCRGTPLSSIRMSFSSFVDNNDLYVLYTDNQGNISSFNGKNKTSVAFTKQNCLMMAKLDDDGADREVVMMPGKAKANFHKLWLFDGKNLFFGMENAKNYTKEHFDC